MRVFNYIVCASLNRWIIWLKTGFLAEKGLFLIFLFVVFCLFVMELLVGLLVVLYV